MSQIFPIVNLLIFSLLFATVMPAKVKPHFCSQPHSADGFVEPVVWRCHGQLPLWSYDQLYNECVQFRFGGCGGNDNAFFSREECEYTCKS